MFVVMALVTTFITTPAVHIIYLRHREVNIAPKEQYAMVLFVPDQKTGMDMVSYAAAVSTPNVGSVKAIFMNEINDRPSSYFFHLSNKLRNDVPFFKDRTAKDMFHTMKKFGSRLGLSVHPKNLNSLHLSDDVKHTAANCIFYVGEWGICTSTRISLLLIRCKNGFILISPIYLRHNHGRAQRTRRER